MSRRARLDIIVIGGGVVGATCALALAGLGLEVALVEGREPARWSPQTPDLRVYAFAPDNADLLQRCGVWNAVREARAQPYRRMQVWDAAGGGETSFDADALGRDQLGWIIENNLLVDRLWSALPAAGVRLHCPARIETLQQEGTSVRVGLDDGLVLDARLAIAADGGQSALRTLAGIGTSGHDYRQQGLVAFVASERPHRDTCWQRFLPSGPVALLPFDDDADPELHGRLSSIVWTLPDAEAQRLRDADPSEFDSALATAFGGELGAFQLQSARAAFPLRRQLADTHVAGRVLLLGDAAHVVHPLAGQGVNLGLRDVAGLRDLVGEARQRRQDWSSPHRLQRWARTRRSENTVAAYSFDAINKVFSNDEMHLTLARGALLGLAGKMPPLMSMFWKRASGL